MKHAQAVSLGHYICVICSVVGICQLPFSLCVLEASQRVYVELCLQSLARLRVVGPYGDQASVVQLVLVCLGQRHRVLALHCVAGVGHDGPEEAVGHDILLVFAFVFKLALVGVDGG
jgi:hypothetical protein